MSILTAHNLSKSFGADDIFAGISLEIPHDARIALVGPNGVGKTTLLHILLDLESPTEGTIHRKRGLEMGYLPQRPELYGDVTVWEEMMGAFTELLAQEQRLKALEKALATPDPATDMDELLAQYGSLQEAFEFAGGYRYEQETRRVLHGLGFNPQAYDKPLSQLSGGQKTRVFLARLLLSAPDLLVLDEPTNHLDIQAVEWLESYLKSWPGAVLLVSHDRYFMDKTVTTIWEMNFGEIEVYRGNYSHYLQQRQERHERRLKEYEAQQAFIQKELDYIQKNIAGQNTRQAQGRRKRLERLMSGTDRRGQAVSDPWLLRRPGERRNFHIALEATRTGNNVFRTVGLTVGYKADVPLLEVPEILLLRGEVAAIIGPNGIGKSTFLKTILGQLPPLNGEYEWGARVKLGYFAQAHEGLNSENTLLDEILSIQFMQTSQARDYLAMYMFTGDDVFRSVSTLSGGERGRLALAKLALQGANVLLLDEPTNHLDIPAQELLEEVLNAFDGTILLVSHDRYLIAALASQIWALESGQMTVFEGSYEEFLVARESARQETIATNDDSRLGMETTMLTPKPKPAHGLNPFQLQKRLAQLEAEIHELETALTQVTTELDSATQAGALDQVAQLGYRYNEITAALDAKMNEWADLA